MDPYVFSLFLVIVTLSILMIAIYVWVFDINNKNNSTNNKLLGLEDFHVENFLKMNKTNTDLLTFYEQPGADPYVEISYGYTTDPGSDLSFSVVDANGNNVVKSTSIKRATNGYKEYRVYFKDMGVEYYTLKYTLANNNNYIDNIEIYRIELSV